MSDVSDAPLEIAEPKGRGAFINFLKRLFKEKPLGAAGFTIVTIFLVAGVFADFLAPYGMNELHPKASLSSPSTQHILGADQLGRDLLSRIIYGARISMVVGLSSASISIIIALILGIPSGFSGGKVDMVIQRVVDAFMCFPGLILLIAVLSLTGPGLWQVVGVLGFVVGIHSTRVIRSAVIDIKENVYVEAAKAIGCKTSRIFIRHIMPNIMAPTIILFSLNVPNLIIAEASLSFLGLGIPPPHPSWGGMLSLEGRKYFLLSPWISLWPGLALVIAVFAMNVFGDALRDIVDPRLRGGTGRFDALKLSNSNKIKPK